MSAIVRVFVNGKWYEQQRTFLETPRVGETIEVGDVGFHVTHVIHPAGKDGRAGLMTVVGIHVYGVDAAEIVSGWKETNFLAKSVRYPDEPSTDDAIRRLHEQHEEQRKQFIDLAERFGYGNGLHCLARGWAAKSSMTLKGMAVWLRSLADSIEKGE